MLPSNQWLARSPTVCNGDEPTSDHTSTGVTADWLFTASVQAVLIIDADTGIIIRANPAASMLLSLSPNALVGAEFLSIFDDASACELKQGFSEARTSGSAGASVVRERGGGPFLSAQLSLVRSVSQTFLVARLQGRAAASRAQALNPESTVMQAIDAAPIGFLIAAADFHIDYANRAFVGMVKAQSQTDVHGNSILRWLRFNAADLFRLRTQLLQRQAADLLITVLHPNRGLPKQVEVCAVPVPDGLDTQWGFTVRHLPRLN